MKIFGYKVQFLVKKRNHPIVFKRFVVYLIPWGGFAREGKRYLALSLFLQVGPSF
jgi:hypothetical protein